MCFMEIRSYLVGGVHPFWKIFVKLGSSPQFWGKHKHVSNHHLVMKFKGRNLQNKCCRYSFFASQAKIIEAHRRNVSKQSFRGGRRTSSNYTQKYKAVKKSQNNCKATQLAKEISVELYWNHLILHHPRSFLEEQNSNWSLFIIVFLILNPKQLVDVANSNGFSWSSNWTCIFNATCVTWCIKRYQTSVWEENIQLGYNEPETPECRHPYQTIYSSSCNDGSDEVPPLVQFLGAPQCGCVSRHDLASGNHSGGSWMPLVLIITAATPLQCYCVLVHWSCLLHLV